jgi:hypothetical protein
VVISHRKFNAHPHERRIFGDNCMAQSKMNSSNLFPSQSVPAEKTIFESAKVRFAAFWRPTQRFGARGIGLPKRQSMVKSWNLLTAVVSEKSSEQCLTLTKEQ